MSIHGNIHLDKKYCNNPIFLLIQLCDARVLFLTEIYYKIDMNASNWITGTKKKHLQLQKMKLNTYNS
jgi:hypothetical protein